MNWQSSVTLVTTLAMIAGMGFGRPPDLILLGGLTVFVSLGILSPAEALGGFSNEGVLSVAALFVVAAGLRQTGALDFLARRLLGKPSTARGAQLRLMPPVALASAFINNTPVVAILLPIVTDWAKRIKLSPSRLLMPLSWATILGGTCTLIGTSTNLVVSGMAKKSAIEFGLFDITWLGVPAALTGIAYVALFSKYLLPERAVPGEGRGSHREYLVAMQVEQDSPVVGMRIDEAGLRQLPGLFLVEIERGERLIAAVGPDERLEAEDRLIFAGVVESVVDLRKIRGITPATNQIEKLARSHPDRCLVEAVVAVGSPLARQSVRASRFRTHYDAAIIAVHRNGQRVRAKVGDIILLPGDTLLLETQPEFVARHGGDPAFALVSQVEGSAPPRHDRAAVAALIAGAMVASNALGLLPLLTATLLACGAMLASRCLTGVQAIRAVEVRIVLAIAASFATGAALEKTGLAALLAGGLVHSAPFGKLGVLAALYLATAVLTELVTNNAAAAFMFPLAVAAAGAAGVPTKPALLLVMMAASASFATPIGYQTNLMVYGPGGYRFSDFLRFGVPLQLLLALVTLSVANLLWL